MTGWIWLTSVETSEPIGIAIHRVTMIEQKEPHTGNVVAIFLDTGKEIRVAETLASVQRMLTENATGQ